MECPQGDQREPGMRRETGRLTGSLLSRTPIYPSIVLSGPLQCQPTNSGRVARIEGQCRQADGGWHAPCLRGVTAGWPDAAVAVTIASLADDHGSAWAQQRILLAEKDLGSLSRPGRRGDSGPSDGRERSHGWLHRPCSPDSPCRMQQAYWGPSGRPPSGRPRRPYPGLLTSYTNPKRKRGRCLYFASLAFRVGVDALSFDLAAWRETRARGSCPTGCPGFPRADRWPATGA